MSAWFVAAAQAFFGIEKFRSQIASFWRDFLVENVAFARKKSARERRENYRYIGEICFSDKCQSVLRSCSEWQADIKNSERCWWFSGGKVDRPGSRENVAGVPSARATAPNPGPHSEGKFEFLILTFFGRGGGWRNLWLYNSSGDGEFSILGIVVSRGTIIRGSEFIYWFFLFMICSLTFFRFVVLFLHYFSGNSKFDLPLKEWELLIFGEKIITFVTEKFWKKEFLVCYWFQTV